MSALDKIIALTDQLYPTGRAWKGPAGGWLKSLHYALALSEAQAYSDAVAIHNSILPDNSGFTEDDATDWERRLGMIQQDTSVPLSDRMLAIRRKIQHPGNIKARQHYLYLQGQLRAAGFDVYVFENRFDVYPDSYETKTPQELSGISALIGNQYGDNQYGDAQYGSSWGEFIANHIDVDRDRTFSIGNNLRSTFFIGADPVGTYASIPASRKDEFRQLVLRIKPVQTVAYLFLVYV